MATKTYPVLQPIEYGTTATDAKRFEIGDTITIEDATSVQLTEFAAIGEPVDPPAKGKK